MDTFKLFQNLPTLRGARSPALATVIGFLFGGIGLAVYFVSPVDAVFPIVIAIMTVGLTAARLHDPALGWFLGASIAAIYGCIRASNSNSRIG
jgi:hypothetical protein